MPRLFTGIEIPALQTQYLSLAQSGLRDVRWIDPSDFHVTLRFIGDVSPHDANNVTEALSSKVWNPPWINFQELACFGGKKPTSLFAKIAQDPALMQLAATQDRLFQRLGLLHDPRKFTPHVTIARCRSASPEQIAAYLSQRAGLAVPAFTPGRFVLYSARESKGGGPYRVEASWPFDDVGQKVYAHNQ